MNDPAAPPPASAPAPIVVGGRSYAPAELARAVRGSANLFWWIAGLSLVNTVGTLFGQQFVMVMGLGIGQVIDAVFVHGLGEAGAFATGLHLLMSAVVAGIFIAIGWAARRPSLPAFVVGIVLYALDAALLAVLGDWVSVGFHALALFFLWGGVATLRAMRAAGVTALAD